MRHDIVYILKEDIDSEELRYSLRSVQENFPHRKVWFFCGCPDDIEPDEYVRFTQTGHNRWQRSTSTFRAINDTDGVSDDFWLFNDDFYILKKVIELPYMMRGLLEEHVSNIRSKRTVSGYASSLDLARDSLERRGLTTYDYALHVPMLINKRKAVEVLDEFPECPMFRSLYGNYWNVGGVKVPDVKVYDTESIPEPGQTLLSTSDGSFQDGKVGEWLKKRFPKPCKWEKR